MRKSPVSLRPPRWFRVGATTAVMAAVVAACGGGGDGGSDDVFEGVVAVGAPVANAQVEFLCADGAPANTRTDASGRYSVSSKDATLPCVAVATGGTVGGEAYPGTLAAPIVQAGTNNVTPLTSLQLSFLAGQELQAWLPRLAANLGDLDDAVTAKKVADALAELKKALAALPTPVTLPNDADPVRTPFAADGKDPLDVVLDRLQDVLEAAGTTLAEVQAQAAARMPLVERTPATLALQKIGGFTHTGGEASAEIVAYDPLSKRLFTVNGALGTVDVLDLSKPDAPRQVATIRTDSFGSGLGGANSVAIHNGIVAMAIEASPKTNNGIVALVRASDLKALGTAPAGALPDMLTFTPDGRRLLVANEGEPTRYGQPNSVDPEGSITIIDLPVLSPLANSVEMKATQVDFRAFNGQRDALRAAGVRIYGPGASVAQDLEPEYIAVSADGKQAYVTLQENNAIAVVDIAAKKVTAIKPLGLKDHSLAGNGLDASDRDGADEEAAIRIRNQPLKALYLPDAIASFRVGTATYLLTANEGDAREYEGIHAEGREDLRAKDFCANGVDPTVFTAGNALLEDANLGRLRVTAYPNGDRSPLNANGQCRELVALGGRSFSVWNSDVAQVFDSGDQFERKVAQLVPSLFNASNDNGDVDDRSPSKGPEPEGVTTGRIGNKTYAFIGLERVGGVMVYDVSKPTAPVFVTYLNTRAADGSGDSGPEGLHFVKAAHSPNGKPLLIVGHETNGTTVVFQLNLGY